MSETILIVDDEQPVRAMLRKLLTDSGYTAIEVESGEQALQTAVQMPVDMVITDLKMPGMDGLALAKRLLEADPDRPVLLLTAFADLDSARQAVKIGIYEYFTKPFDVNDVMAGARRALERRRLLQQIRTYQQNLEWKVKARTRELEQAYGELVKTEKLSAVGRLVGGVVHEALNPLSVVLGRIDMVLEGDALNAPDRRSLQLAREQADRAVRMLDNLGNFSRQRSPRRGAVDLNALLTQALELVAHEANRRSVEVITRLEDLPVAQADRDQLSQVFVNLLNNAIDAMSNGGSLTIETGVLTDVRGPIIEVRFADTGPGIPEADLPRIFEPFFTTRENGMGLGLAICRGIVEVHEGRIEAQSREGRGTTFIVSLPAQRTENRG